MVEGDRVGLTLLWDSSAWIGVVLNSGVASVVMVSNCTMNMTTWDAINTATEMAATGASGGQIWLRVSVNIAPGPENQEVFSYSFGGVAFTSLGPLFVLDSDWEFFMGYRFGIFNYATVELGGSVNVVSFDLSTP